jgi:hypothetical protein
LRIVSTSSTPPAWETTPRPQPSVRTRGYDPIRLLTWRVLLSCDDLDPRQVPSLQVRSTLRVSDHPPDALPRESARLTSKFRDGPPAESVDRFRQAAC